MLGFNSPRTPGSFTCQPRLRCSSPELYPDKTSKSSSNPPKNTPHTASERPYTVTLRHAPPIRLCVPDRLTRLPQPTGRFSRLRARHRRLRTPRLTVVYGSRMHLPWALGRFWRFLSREVGAIRYGIPQFSIVLAAVCCAWIHFARLQLPSSCTALGEITEKRKVKRVSIFLRAFPAIAMENRSIRVDYPT